MWVSLVFPLKQVDHVCGVFTIPNLDCTQDQSLPVKHATTWPYSSPYVKEEAVAVYEAPNFMTNPDLNTGYEADAGV